MHQGFQAGIRLQTFGWLLACLLACLRHCVLLHSQDSRLLAEQVKQLMGSGLERPEGRDPQHEEAINETQAWPYSSQPHLCTIISALSMPKALKCESWLFS